MAEKKRRGLEAIRKTAMQDNAFIGNAERKIEEENKLPVGSVRLVLSNGRDAPLTWRLRKLLRDRDE